MPQTCPQCGSTAKEKPTDEDQKRAGKFQALPLRKCADCKHVWEPPAPVWVLVLGVLAGLFLVAFGLTIAFLSGEKVRWGVLSLLAFPGAIVVAGCVIRLRQKLSS